jgi:hypothetical protein
VTRVKEERKVFMQSFLDAARVLRESLRPLLRHFARDGANAVLREMEKGRRKTSAEAPPGKDRENTPESAA